MATVGEASVQDDEWFGEGSAFDSGEDLAAALFALAGTARIDAIPKAESDWPTGMRDVRRSEGDSDFVEVARTGGLDGARRAGSMPNGTRTATTTPGTWSVRNPGEQLLPPKVSGRSGDHSQQRCRVAPDRRGDCAPSRGGRGHGVSGRGRSVWPGPAEFPRTPQPPEVAVRQRSYWRSRSST